MDDQGAHAGHPPQGDKPAGHGMVIVGEKTVYLSHLPMFMVPHDLQVILEATFTKPGSDPQRAYADDRKRNPKAKLYTLRPESFVLPDLFPDDGGRPPRRRSFVADLFRNHFERENTKPEAIATGAVVNVTSVVHAHRFDPKAKALDQLQYILFGKGQEVFATHLITRPPDFDHVLSVKVAGRAFTDIELRGGVPVRVSGKANSVKERLRAGKRVSGLARVGGKDVPVEIEPGVEFYLEEGDLAEAM